MNYTLTLIEKTDPGVKPEFDPLIEGQPLDVPFVVLDAERGNFLRLAPITKRNLDKTFAIYVTGHVAVDPEI